MAVEYTVVDQLTEYCNCTDVKESDVYELINLISSYTGWTQNLCETFLESERREVVDLPDCLDDCDIYTFTPFYAPFDPETFTFTLIEQNGLTETATEITNYLYSTVDENFRMELPLPDCKCKKPECGCESTYKLVVTYIAGFELIPECLIPVFCSALQYIYDKNNCECDTCTVCEEDKTDETYIDETTLEGQLTAYFLSVLAKQYRRQLSLISLLRTRQMLWGVVV